MADIHQFNHRAMSTYFELRIANQERTYASQAAQEAIDLLDSLESRLSRFRANSDISQVALLEPGQKMRLSEPVFACLEIAKRMETATRSAFSVAAAALREQAALPQWSLSPEDFSIRCESGRLTFDLGAIGKGFALDCMAVLLHRWDCPSFLLIGGGSSILTGDPAAESDGWSCGLGDGHARERFFLTRASLSGSGLTVKGSHILDPRTGRPALRQDRAWAIADTAAESDALSTACMVLSEPEIEEVLAQEPSWLVFLNAGESVRPIGKRSLPLVQSREQFDFQLPGRST